MSIQIDDIKKISIQPGEILVIEVDCGNLPPSRQKQTCDDIFALIRPILPPGIQVIISPKGHLTFGILQPGQQPPVLSGSSSTSGSLPDPQSDYDRAMKGI